MRTGITDVEDYAIEIDLENEELRDRWCCRAVEIGELRSATVAADTVFFEILLAERAKTAHMDEGIGVVFPDGICFVQIVAKGLSLVVDMQNRTRGILSEAGMLAVQVTVKVEAVAVTSEDLVEQRAASVVHGLAKRTVVIVVDRRQMTEDENRLRAVLVDLVELFFDPQEGFVVIVSLVGIEGRIGSILMPIKSMPPTT